jgi:prevent-host-death family protein
MGEPAEVSVRDLRNHVSDILRRVEAGERLRVTVDRRPVAQIIPLPIRRAALPMAEFLDWLGRTGGADRELAGDLHDTVGDTTDDLEIT